MRVTTSATLSPTGSASAALPATSPAPFASALLGLVDTLAGAGASGLINAVGTVARFSAPQGLAVDWFSNVYVADSGNNVVRVVVASTRAVSTLAGGGASGSLGGQADGAGSNALFLAPGYVAVDVAGQLYVSDVGNGCVRRVAVSSGLTTTFVGGGASGFATGFADGTGTNALFNGPMQLALDPSSFTLYLVDAYSHAVRALSRRWPVAAALFSAPPVMPTALVQLHSSISRRESQSTPQAPHLLSQRLATRSCAPSTSEAASLRRWPAA